MCECERLRERGIMLRLQRIEEFAKEQPATFRTLSLSNFSLFFFIPPSDSTHSFLSVIYTYQFLRTCSSFSFYLSIYLFLCIRIFLFIYIYLSLCLSIFLIYLSHLLSFFLCEKCVSKFDVIQWGAFYLFIAEFFAIILS